MSNTPAPRHLVIAVAAFCSAVSLATLAITSDARADDSAPLHNDHGKAPAATDSGNADANTLPWVEATVRKVDAAQGKLTLKHSEIPNLDMPPMSMVFKAQSPAMLEGLKAGDQVRFQAKEINGAYTAVNIEKK